MLMLGYVQGMNELLAPLLYVRHEDATTLYFHLFALSMSIPSFNYSFSMQGGSHIEGASRSSLRRA